ncbi:MAG: hypothetical protein ACI91B_004598 [Planctomycetota bacterium]
MRELDLRVDNFPMSFSQSPASVAHALIEGYCDEFLSLASLFAEALVQADSRGIDITSSQNNLDCFKQGMASLGAVIDELRQSEPPARTAPAEPEPDSRLESEPEPEAAVPFRTMPNLTDEAAWGSSALAAGQVDEKPPADVDHAEIDARVVEAYSFLVDSEESGQRSDAADREANEIDPNAPVHFDRRPAPGFGRALKSLPSNTGGVTNKALAKAIGDSGSDETVPGVSVNPSLKGSNASMPVHSVFQFIERVRKSGVMRVELADEAITFEFEGGWVHSCRTNNLDKGDRLGDLLAGVCDEKELRVLLEQAEAMNNLQIGELIVRSGLVSNGQVLDALEAQIHRRFGRACESAEATYEFVEGVVVKSDGRVRIAPMELAFQARS